MNNDSRIIAIRHWLEQDLRRQISYFAPASSDASFRRYFRITDQTGTYIVMDAPPDKENIGPFLSVAELFKTAGVNVPTILQQNKTQGFLLLEDFGSTAYLEQLQISNPRDLYQDAFDSLLRIQAIDTTTTDLPQYNRALLSRELGVFEEWFLGAWLKLAINDEMQVIIKQTWSVLIESALAQPTVCVHRDYHSRNLMFLNNNNPGIIDFQDAVVGPVTYDPVSLLKDCYIQWPEAQVQSWALNYFALLQDSNPIQCDQDTFITWFDLMGMQRHLKAIGIFARLKLRDNKPDYIKDIPRTLTYVNQVSQRYDSLKPFHQLLNDTLLKDLRINE